MPPAVQLHRVGRAHSEQCECVRERDLGCLDQRQSGARALGLVRIHDPGVAVEGVERRGEIGRERGDALRLAGRCGVLDDLRQPDEGTSEQAFGRSREPARDGVSAPDAGPGRLAEDRRDPGVGVLDVVDGVLVRLLLGELDVEIDAARGRPRGEEPARRVDADLGRAARRA